MKAVQVQSGAWSVSITSEPPTLGRTGPAKPAQGKLGADVEGVSPVLHEYPGQQDRTKQDKCPSLTTFPGGRGRGQSDWAGEGEGEAPVSRVQKRNTEPKTMGCHGHRFGPLKVKKFRYQNVRTRRKVRNVATEAVA